MKRIWKFKEIGNSFQHDMAYGDFKDLRDKTFNIAKNLKYDGYQRGLASMVYNSFDKKNV